MQKRLCLMLALLSAMVLGAWADGASSFSGGDGTLKSPYVIGTAADWDQLATDVAAGTSYSGQYFRLDADISVSTMVGTGTSSSDAKSFNGTFDGNGHKLTVGYEAADDVATAPFRFLRNATIRNLHVDGNITANHKYVLPSRARQPSATDAPSIAPPRRTLAPSASRTATTPRPSAPPRASKPATSASAKGWTSTSSQQAMPPNTARAASPATAVTSA